ncbi:G-protein coupled receptor 12-like [Sphaerodactylus townsendi]|uniref:G-protein coupled receptor 12-like n=1 Tax=Sphaerodactylus townsendi TaxID=933632 RepID=UPI0020267D6A|nr:G-protein coupled receptor 12-like [Sphaerodactylus townsendi]
MLSNPAAAAALDPQTPQTQQQQLLALLNVSGRPLASLWPPSSEWAPSGAPSEPPPGTGWGQEAGRGPGWGRAWPVGAVSPWEVALCATGTAVAGENALVLAALLWAASRRAAAFLLIGSLALADLLAGLALLLHFAVRHLLAPRSETAALGSAGLLLTAFSASLGSLLAITLDRYLSLHKALTYRPERTPGSTAALLALMWLLCLGLGLLPLLGWNCLRPPAACSVLRPLTKQQAALLSAAFLLLFALMLQLYLQICRVACRHAQQIAGQRHSQAASSSSSSRKGLATLSLVLGTFGLLWGPLAVYALVADATYPPAYTYSLALPAACNSLLNPLIYAFRTPEIQKALWLACCCCAPATFARPTTSSHV